MDDDGYYYSMEDAVKLLNLTKARINNLEKKAFKRLAMTDEDKKFFDKLESEINNDELFKELYRYYLSSDITVDDLKNALKKNDDD